MLYRILFLLIFMCSLPCVSQARPEPSSAKEVRQTLLGTVSDETGDPLPGAVIRVKNTSYATVSDIDGKFSLSAPLKRGVVITFSSMGMKPEEIGW